MIGRLLSSAMLSLVMDKQAKDKLRAIRQGGKATERAPDQPAPDRRQLIAQAMAIHQTQSKIFDDLTLNEKRRLRELAAKTMLGGNNGL